MTLHATRSGQQITIGSSFGIGEVHHKYEVTEHVSHLRYFWGQLGTLIDEAEKEQVKAVETNSA